MNTPSQFKFLDDSCATVDLTDDKTHQRIADQLYELIVNGDSRGMTIGLEGDWGSGKSTVVELLRQKLEKDEKTFFFYIDTWAHEGDPLRRAFLEMAIASLERKDSLSPKVRKRLAEIKSNIVQQKTIVHRSLTGLGKVTAVAALLVPVGTRLVSLYAPHVTLRRTGSLCWGFIAGVLLCLAPAIAYVPAWLLIKAWRHFFPKPGTRDSAIFSSERTIDISVKDDRTSLELAHFFEEIIAAITPCFSKIVMVIDNLDRVEQEDALKIWSTLQAFVQRKNPHGIEPDELPRWIIVPYVRESFEKIWHGENCPENKKDGVASNNSEGSEALSHGDSRLASFMDKAFDLRLHVPNMVVGDWQTFASDCIRKVLPPFSAEEVSTILNVLIWTRKQLTDAPSPRQIKLYANQIVLLYQLHKTRVSLSAVCFYVITRYLGNNLSDDDIKKALVRRQIHNRSLPLYSGPLASEMAAIVFNVDKEKASQVILESGIRKDLESQAIDGLRKTRENYGGVFDSVIGYILNHTLGIAIPGFIVSIQKAFGELSATLCDYAYQSMRTHLENVVTAIESMAHCNVLELIKLAKRDKDLSKMLAEKHISNVVYRFSNSTHFFDNMEPDVPEMSQGSYLLRLMSETSSAADQDIKIPYDELIQGKFAFERLNENEMEEFVGYLGDLDAADKHLAQFLSDPRRHWPSWLATWFGALTAHGMTRIDRVFKALEEVLDGQAVNIMQTPSKDTYWGILVAMEPMPRSLLPVERIQGLLLKAFNRMSPNDGNSKAFFLMAKYLKDKSDKDGSFDIRISPYILASYRNFMDRDDAVHGRELYQYTALSEEREWLAELVATPQRRLGGEIVKAALKADDPWLFQVSSPYGFVSNVWALLKGEDRTQLVDKFMSDSGRLCRLTEPDGERLTTSPESCLELLAKCPENRLRHKLMNKCVAELSDMTQEQWERVLSQKGTSQKGIVELITFLEDNGCALKFGAAFSGGFQNCLFGIMSKAGGSQPTFKELSSLYRSMEATRYAMFAKSIGFVLLERHMKAPTEGLRRFLVEVPDYDEWLQDSQAEIGSKLLVLISAHNFDNLELFSEILEHQANRGTWWDAIRLSLDEPLKQLADSPNSRIKDAARRIQSNLELGNMTGSFGNEVDDSTGNPANQKNPNGGES